MELYLSNPKRPHGMKFSQEQGKLFLITTTHLIHMNGSLLADHSKFEL
jgi:hypothetical protein